MNRCPWCLINELETKYHNEEWGVPVHDDGKQFAYLMMEVVQCGLSWDTVLKKRGMKYLGPVTVYANLQACCIVNDHQKDCHRYGWLIEQHPVE